VVVVVVVVVVVYDVLQIARLGRHV